MSANNLDLKTLQASLQEQLNGMEAYRRTYKNKFLRIMLILLGIYVALQIAFYFCIEGSNNISAITTIIVTFLLLVWFFVLIVGFFVLRKKNREHVSAYYKSEIMPKFVSKIADDISYVPTMFVPEQIFRRTKLYGGFDRYSGEDLMRGTIGKTQFMFSEIKAEEKRKTAKGATYYITTFGGIIFTADFNKNFNGVTLLSSSLDSFLGFRSFDTKKIKMENVEFNETFKTYTTDEVEARYILSPALMEKFINIQKTFGKRIEVSFNNSQVTVLLHTSRNCFEAKLFSPMNIERIGDDFMLIKNLTGIIEELNLNTRIWTKE